MKEMKEEENTFLPSYVPISTSSTPVVTHACGCFTYTLNEVSEEG